MGYLKTNTNTKGYLKASASVLRFQVAFYPFRA